MKKNVEHYLLTIPLGATNFHAYILTNDGERRVMLCADKALAKLEEEGIQPMVPIILSTRLDDQKSIDTVRELMVRMGGDAVRKNMATATTFHWTGLLASRDNAEDLKLMEFH